MKWLLIALTLFPLFLEQLFLCWSLKSDKVSVRNSNYCGHKPYWILISISNFRYWRHWIIEMVTDEELASVTEKIIFKKSQKTQWNLKCNGIFKLLEIEWTWKQNNLVLIYIFSSSKVLMQVLFIWKWIELWISASAQPILCLKRIKVLIAIPFNMEMIYYGCVRLAYRFVMRINFSCSSSTKQLFIDRFARRLAIILECLYFLHLYSI